MATNYKLLNLGSLDKLLAYFFKEPILVVDLKLVFEARTPVMLSVKCLH